MSREQLDVLVQKIRERRPPDDITIEEDRERFETIATAFPVDPEIAVEPVQAGGVPAEWNLAPGAAPEKVMLYLHGGGYCIGSLNTHRTLVGRLSRAAGMRVLSVAYRLAPEHPHPAALEDARAAYGWLLEQGIEPGNVIVAGDSAGGGLALSLLLALRDEGAPLPAAGVCLAPSTDKTLSGESHRTKVEADPILSPGRSRGWLAAYVGENDPADPAISPLFADLGGLPPLLILVGSEEMLLDDSTRFGEKARAAGVEVTVEVWEEMFHIWPLFAHLLEEGQYAIDRIGAWCRQRLGLPAADNATAPGGDAAPAAGAAPGTPTGRAPGPDLEPLVEALEADLARDEFVPELLARRPGLTIPDAYRVQMALMNRAVSRGDRILGYKAALTTKAMQQQVGIGEPLLGTLMAGRQFPADEPVSLKGFLHSTLEPEVAVLLAHDLPGPGVTPVEALAAVAAYLPAVELGDYRTGPTLRSVQEVVACNTVNGGWIIGAPPVSPLGIDLRLEGMVLRCNGQVRGSATAVEVLGDPIHSVVFMANKLAELGLTLKAGMVLLTGSIVASIPIQPGDEVRVSFTRLGELAVRFVG